MMLCQRSHISFHANNVYRFIIVHQMSLAFAIFAQSSYGSKHLLLKWIESFGWEYVPLKHRALWIHWNAETKAGILILKQCLAALWLIFSTWLSCMREYICNRAPEPNNIRNIQLCTHVSSTASDETSKLGALNAVELVCLRTRCHNTFWHPKAQVFVKKCNSNFKIRPALWGHAESGHESVTRKIISVELKRTSIKEMYSCTRHVSAGRLKENSALGSKVGTIFNVITIKVPHFALLQGET